MTIRVGVCGAGGRMGATVCRAITGDDAFDLVAAVDPSAADIVGGVTVAADIAEFARRRMRGRRRLHDGRGGSPERARAREPGHPRRRRNDRFDRGGPGHLRGRCRRTREWSRPRRRQLLDLGGSADAALRIGRPVLRHHRDHRVAPRRQGRRALGHGDHHRRAHRRGVRTSGLRTRRPRRRSPRHVEQRVRPESASMPCGCVAWSPIRRSSSVPRVRR